MAVPTARIDEVRVQYGEDFELDWQDVVLKTDFAWRTTQPPKRVDVAGHEVTMNMEESVVILTILRRVGQ